MARMILSWKRRIQEGLATTGILIGYIICVTHPDLHIDCGGHYLLTQWRTGVIQSSGDAELSAWPLAAVASRPDIYPLASRSTPPSRLWMRTDTLMTSQAGGSLTIGKWQEMKETAATQTCCLNVKDNFVAIIIIAVDTDQIKFRTAL